MARAARNRFTDVAGGIQQLQGAYALERKVFLGGIALGILLIAFFSVMMAFGFIDKKDWIVVFSPPGAFVGMCTAAMTYFNKSLEILAGMARGQDGN